jgi:hypothetical protein
LAFAANGGGANMNIGTSGNVGIGIGVVAPSNRLHVESTTSPQLRISYDGTYYATQSVASSGEVTFATQTNQSTAQFLNYTFSSTITPTADAAVGKYGVHNTTAFNATSGDISIGIGNYNVATFTAAGSNVISSAFGAYNLAQTASNGTVSAIIGLQQYVRFANAGNTCAIAQGIVSDVASATGYASNMYGIVSSAGHNVNVDIAAMYGYYGGANNASASNVTYNYGLFSYANNTSTGSVTNQRAIYCYSQNSSSGTVTSSRGIQVETYNQGTGVVAYNYGIVIEGATNSGGGTISNNYGLLIAAQTAGLQNYAIYSAGGRVFSTDANTSTGSYNANEITSTFTPTADAAVGKYGLYKTNYFNATSGDISTSIGIVNYTLGTATGSNVISEIVGINNDTRTASTGTVTTLYGIRQYVRFDTAANTCTTSYGMYIDSTASTGCADTQVGVSAFVSHQVNRAITGLFGGVFDTYAQSASNMQYSYAVVARAFNTAAGAVGNQRGISVETHNTSTGVVTNNYGINIASAVNSGGGTISNNYGLHIEAQTAGLQNYAIYSAGGQSYHAGNFGIGTTAPSNKFHVKNSDTATAAVQIESIGATGATAALIEFTGVSAVDTSSNISTAALGAYQGKIRVKINGVTRWLAFYD